jgi:hypothetical protein
MYCIDIQTVTIKDGSAGDIEPLNFGASVRLRTTDSIGKSETFAMARAQD